MAGDVVEPLNVILRRGAAVGIIEALLQIEGRDRLAVQCDLNPRDLRQVTLVERGEIADLIRARECRGRNLYSPTAAFLQLKVVRP